MQTTHSLAMGQRPWAGHLILHRYVLCCNIAVSDDFRTNLPRTINLVARQPFEIKLTAHLQQMCKVKTLNAQK